ncbi:hypothetical protein FUAX_55670 (plasmid) [Fulvitalea axinellae]|uniref:Uncharacterized protein n=1 Tax=Fulvitalea axinellae TaxID=1182444 RepID=A0AAU9DPH0_9BACT|nr:hypothetical protein FUAX_55670 [Fulvitalea axinellae]
MSVFKGPDGQVYGVTGSGVVRLGAVGARGGSASARTNTDRGAVQKKTDSDIASWGDDNLFPQRRKKLFKANTIIPTTLYKLANILVAGGIAYGRIDREGDQETFIAEHIPEVENFLQRSLIREHYLPETALDWYTWKNIFPMVKTSRNGDKITQLIRQASPNCRWGKMDNSGVIKDLHISSEWEDSETPQLTLPVIDKWNDDRGELEPGNYIYPMNSPYSDTPFYNLAEWDSVFSSGWFDVAQAIPEFKKALMANQMTIKYEIVVATWYWEEKYKDWHTKSEGEQIELMKAELDNFEKVMKGEENAGKSVMTFKKEINGKEEAAWEINPIDDKIQNGVYVEDSQEASSQIFYGMGADPALFGTAPGSKKEGSGSDKNNAYHLHMIFSKPDQDKILEPLNNLVSPHNGWKSEGDKPLRFWFRDYQIARLETVSPSDR